MVSRPKFGIRPLLEEKTKIPVRRQRRRVDKWIAVFVSRALDNWRKARV